MSEKLFSEEFINEFNSTGFYAKPKMTEITISFGKDKKTTIGNAVTLNVEHSNEKVPVYSYNSDTYAKFLNGKDVITGVLALRKTTVDKFISLISEVDNEKNEEIAKEEEKEKVEIIEILLGATNESKEISFLTNKINSVKSGGTKTYTREIEKNNGLLYYSDISRKNNAKITITYKDDMLEEQDEIYDVLFIKKNSDISVSNNDIIEVYQFIGNPKSSMKYEY